MDVETMKMRAQKGTMRICGKVAYPFPLPDPLDARPQPVLPAAKPGILVVDDEAPIRTLLRLGLRSFGFNVWAAASGQEAQEVYKIHRREIDLVLMDVCMPQQDGPTTLTALQRIDGSVRCCFMSAHSGQYSADNLLDTGAIQVFTKPFRLADLAEGLKHLTTTACSV